MPPNENGAATPDAKPTDPSSPATKPYDWAIDITGEMEGKGIIITGQGMPPKPTE